MAQHAQVGTHPDQDGREPTIGALVHDLSQEIPELVRSEIRLAQAEVAQKGREVGTGVGMFSAAGLLAFFGTAALIATAILALAEALPAWLSALIVTVALFALAGIVALVGRKKVSEGQPLKPERAVAGVQKDIATVKGAAR
jgi:uncharacterized membrane protein YqjE